MGDGNVLYLGGGGGGGGYTRAHTFVKTHKTLHLTCVYHIMQKLYHDRADFLKYMLSQMVVSGMKKNQERRLAIRGKGRGCSLKHGAQGSCTLKPKPF